MVMMNHMLDYSHSKDTSLVLDIDLVCCLKIKIDQFAYWAFVALWFYTIFNYINKTKIFNGMCNGISTSTHTQLKVEYWISDSH